MRSKEAAGAVAMFCFGALTAYLSSRMSIGNFRFAGPGMFPLCLGLVLMVLAGIHLGGVYLGSAAGVKEGSRPLGDRFSGLPALLFLASIAMAAILLGYAGYAATAFVLVFFLLEVLARRNWRRNILIALAAGAFSYLVFVKWLKIPFPGGWPGL
ncbi:MAG: tripartite tricarboxylate transporter TctB family protein [Syntrophobacteraceae bacterium]